MPLTWPPPCVFRPISRSWWPTTSGCFRLPRRLGCLPRRRARRRVGAMPVRAPLKPGELTPQRPVPATIPRPEYVGKPAPARNTDPWVQPPEVIEAMRVAGKIAAQSLQVAGDAVRPGATTDDVDRVVHEFLCDHGAYPSTLG